MTTEDDEQPTLKPIPLLAPGEKETDFVSGLGFVDRYGMTFAGVVVGNDEVQRQRRIGWNLAVSHAGHAFDEGRVAERAAVLAYIAGPGRYESADTLGYLIEAGRHLEGGEE